MICEVIIFNLSDFVYLVIEFFNIYKIFCIFIIDMKRYLVGMVLWCDVMKFM